MNFDYFLKLHVQLLLSQIYVTNNATYNATDIAKS